MAILFGIVIAALLILSWLSGSWAGRVLMFIALAIPGACALGSMFVTGPIGLIFGTLGLALAWLISSLPTYYWRSRIRQMMGQPSLARQWIAREFG